MFACRDNIGISIAVRVCFFTQVAITAYQPIDTVTKTVEVPVVRTVETYVPKVVVEEKIIKVPKYVPEYVEKVSRQQYLSHPDQSPQRLC